MIWRVALLFGLMLSGSPVLAGQTVQPRVLGVDIPYALFHDVSGALDVDAVAALPESAFTPRDASLALGYIGGAAWLRFRLPDAGGVETEWWLELYPPTLDSIRLHEWHGAGWQVRHEGDRLPYGSREVPHRNVVFRLAPAEGQGREFIYLRVESVSSLYLIGTLHSAAGFIQHSAEVAMKWGLYFGSLTIALAFMLAMVAINRSRPYLVLSAALLMNGLHVANSHGFLTQSLWAMHPTWGDASVGWTGGLAMATLLWSLREFLTRNAGPRWADRLYLLAIVCCGLAPVSIHLNLYGPTMQSALLLFLCGLVGGLLLLASRWRRAGRFECVLGLAVLAMLLAFLTVFLPLSGFAAASINLPITRSSVFIFLALLAATVLLLEVRHTYDALLAEKSHALALAGEAERVLEQRVVERTRALSSLNQELARLEADQRQFISMLSHEVRSPLAVMDATAELLAQRLGSGDGRLPLVARIRRAVARLSNLFDNCLTRDRIDGGNFVMHRETLAPAELVHWARESALLLADGHRIEPSIVEPLPMLEADPMLLRIALTNLLSNAVKYSPSGSRVRIAAACVDDRLTIEVCDEGCGIPEDEMQQIFERFRRGRTAAGSTGAGLGLAVARRIVELHGGELAVCNRSAIGRTGACFSITLPLGDARAGVAVGQLPSQQA